MTYSANHGCFGHGVVVVVVAGHRGRQLAVDLSRRQNGKSLKPIATTMAAKGNRYAKRNGHGDRDISCAPIERVTRCGCFRTGDGGMARRADEVVEMAVDDLRGETKTEPV